MGPVLRLVRYGFTIEIYGLPFWHVPLMRTEVDAMAPERIAISINQILIFAYTTSQKRLRDTVHK